ncbi:MAG: hypothetical protein E7652_04300 [Ruminococcaceae bacterium]|nr:hypothetical protein [Oscillospiraceae bacterium]
MHTYRPPKENKIPTAAPIFLLLICFVCIWASKTGNIIPPSIMQLLAVASAAIAIQIMTRYSLTHYVYELNHSKLKVIKVVGNKNTLSAELDLSDIRHIDKKNKDYSLKKKYKKAFRIHNFCNNIYPRNAYCLVCEILGDNIAVVIEADEKFLSLIENYMMINKNTGEE